MNKSNLLVIAGVSFNPNFINIIEELENENFEILFLEHKHTVKYIKEKRKNIRICDSLPHDIINREGIFLPLLESWVSEGLKMPINSKLKFPFEAAKLSRSKLLLSKKLSDYGFDYIPRIKITTIDQAFIIAENFGYPIVIRSDVGYSSRGVWIANNFNEIPIIWKKLELEKNNSDYKSMKKIMNVENESFTIEPWLQGEEWSLDSINGGNQGSKIIRICLKSNEIVSGKPVTLGYHICQNSKLFDELTEYVSRWNKILFQENDISYSCFDVKRNRFGRFVPLDFAVRLGGDQIYNIVSNAIEPKNPYSSVLNSVLCKKPYSIIKYPNGLSIVHVFSKKRSVFKNLVLKNNGKIVFTKPDGFIINEEEFNSNIFKKVGSILKSFNSENLFFEACENPEDFVDINYY